MWQVQIHMRLHGSTENSFRPSFQSFSYNRRENLPKKTSNRCKLLFLGYRYLAFNYNYNSYNNNDSALPFKNAYKNQSTLDSQCKFHHSSTDKLQHWDEEWKHPTSSPGNRCRVFSVGNPLPHSSLTGLSAPYSTTTSSSIQFTRRQNSFSTVAQDNVWTDNSQHQISK